MHPNTDEQVYVCPSYSSYALCTYEKISDKGGILKDPYTMLDQHWTGFPLDSKNHFFRSKSHPGKN